MINQSKQILKILVTKSPFKIIQTLQENKVLINTYLKGETYEGLNGDTGSGIATGLTAVWIIILVLLSIILFVWNIWAFMEYAKTMPTWAVITAVILFFFTGGIFSLIMIYAFKGQKSSYSSFHNTYGFGDGGDYDAGDYDGGDYDAGDYSQGDYSKGDYDGDGFW
jgi:hypothetical protein